MNTEKIQSLNTDEISNFGGNFAGIVSNNYQQEFPPEFNDCQYDERDIPPMPEWHFNENDIPPEMPDFGGSFAGDVPYIPDIPEVPEINIPTVRGKR